MKVEKSAQAQPSDYASGQFGADEALCSSALASLVEALSEGRGAGAHAAPKFRLSNFYPTPNWLRQFIKKMKAMRAAIR